MLEVPPMGLRIPACHHDLARSAQFDCTLAWDLCQGVEDRPPLCGVCVNWSYVRMKMWSLYLVKLCAADIFDVSPCQFEQIHHQN